jgi:hypothetical protein
VSSDIPVSQPLSERTPLRGRHQQGQLTPSDQTASDISARIWARRTAVEVVADAEESNITAFGEHGRRFHDQGEGEALTGLLS